jgi:alanine dehydrogenase
VFAKTARRFAPLQAKYPQVKFLPGAAELESFVGDADLVIGGVLTPGQMSPKLLTRSMLRRMRRGSALVDVSIDQGGIAETSRPTSHTEPIYIEEGVVHYCVPNMPSACARTASLALGLAVLPFLRKLSANGLDDDLRSGMQVDAGRITHAQLARDTRRPYR